jgi:hypothetical protein
MKNSPPQGAVTNMRGKVSEEVKNVNMVDVLSI